MIGGAVVQNTASPYNAQNLCVCVQSCGMQDFLKAKTSRSRVLDGQFCCYQWRAIMNTVFVLSGYYYYFKCKCVMCFSVLQLFDAVLSQHWLRILLQSADIIANIVWTSVECRTDRFELDVIIFAILSYPTYVSRLVFWFLLTYLILT